MRNFDVSSKAGPFTFAEMQTVTCLSRGEIRECINRGIISARAGIGQGNHRAYSKWNLVEGVIAAALLRHIRAGSVAALMLRLRLLLLARQIDPEAYCLARNRFDFHRFELLFPPRTKPDGRVDLTFGEDAGEGAFLIATASATKEPANGPALTSDTPSEPFCKFSVDLEKAVLFVDYMVNTKL
jgi:hypothetical protein